MATCQGIMHVIDNSANVLCFRYSQWSGIIHLQPLFALTAEIQLTGQSIRWSFFVIQRVSLSSQTLEKLRKNVL